MRPFSFFSVYSSRQYFSPLLLPRRFHHWLYLMKVQQFSVLSLLAVGNHEKVYDHPVFYQSAVDFPHVFHYYDDHQSDVLCH